MKKILLLGALCTGITCQAAEPATSITPGRDGRCPMAAPKIAKMPRGDYEVKVRYVLKADGSTDNVRTEGKAPREAKRLVAHAFADLRCLPGEADEERTATFGLKTREH